MTALARFQILFKPTNESQHGVLIDLVDGFDSDRRAEELELLQGFHVALDRTNLSLPVLQTFFELPDHLFDTAATRWDFRGLYGQLAFAYAGEIALDVLVFCKSF